MIYTSGMISVEEASKRLHRSTEQVRRNLRAGKLKGQRIGNQWFVDEGSIARNEDEPVEDESMEKQYLIPRELVEEIRRTREEIFRRNGYTFDVVAMLREDRESH